MSSNDLLRVGIAIRLLFDYLNASCTVGDCDGTCVDSHRRWIGQVVAGVCVLLCVDCIVVVVVIGINVVIGNNS